MPGALTKHVPGAVDANAGQAGALEQRSDSLCASRLAEGGRRNLAERHLRINSLRLQIPDGRSRRLNRLIAKEYVDGLRRDLY